MSRIQRRQFVIAASALLGAPLVRAQQPGKIYRLGVFLFRQNPVARTHMGVLRERLKQLGFAEGRNLHILEEYSSPDPNVQRENVQKLVGARPDAILSFGSTNTRLVHTAARGIPVVFSVVGDPIAYGLVKNLGRPGDNLTGIAWMQQEMTIKRLELLHEVLPKARRILFAGYLKDVTYVASEPVYRDIASRFGLELVGADGTGGRLLPAVTAAMEPGVDALFILQPLSFIEPQDALEEVIRLASAWRVPVFVAESDLVALGALLSYGPAFLEETRRAADLVARVLKGANAGELPVDQTSRFELVVNPKVAKALGIALPQSVRVRADRVIE
jgi:putative ABC transport system substrate-binding protein